jgi:hypothetical protein
MTLAAAGAVVAVGILCPPPRGLAREQEARRLASLLPEDAPRVTCLTCHSGWRDEERRKIRRTHNVFGRAYERWARQREAAPADLLQGDADRDGFSNLDELTAGSNPGDRKRVPLSEAERARTLDPTGRLRAMIERQGKSSDRQLQRQAAAVQFLLAVFDRDEDALDAVLSSAGYQEVGENTTLSAPALLRRWDGKGIEFEPGASLGGLLNCRGTSLVMSKSLKALVPGLRGIVPATEYPVVVPRVGDPPMITGEVVLFLERRYRRWQVVRGNVFAVFVRPATTQPAEADGSTPEVTTRPAGAAPTTQRASSAAVPSS